MSLQIAQAAVDDATIHFDKLYSYCIPPRLNDKVWPGSMVLVPFGRGNKPRMAVVLSVAALPEDADTQNLKTLYDAAPAEARLTPDLLELVRFLKDRTSVPGSRPSRRLSHTVPSTVLPWKTAAP